MPRSSASSKSLGRLIALVARLRSPRGCPWDRKQTHRSLLSYLREETAEVEKALKRGRWEEIEDELGDLLLQVLLHAQIESEKGRFTIYDVARSQYFKLKRRHPHVFGRNRRYRDADEVLANWDEIKKGERALWKKDIARRLSGRAASRSAGTRRRSLP